MPSSLFFLSSLFDYLFITNCVATNTQTNQQGNNQTSKQNKQIHGQADDKQMSKRTYKYDDNKQ